MKNLSVILALSLLALAARAALPQPDLLAQIHFAGAQRISAEPNSAAFTNEFCSAEALALRAQTATKLSGWLADWLQKNLGMTAADGAAKLRPLLDDLQTAEWLVDARLAADGKPVVTVAVKLDSARGELWQAGLKPYQVNFYQSGGWLFCGFNTSAEQLGRLRTPPAPVGWLDLDVNWPRLAHWYPKLKELALPETQFTVSSPDTNFRIIGKFYFPENLTLNLEPWRVPTNTVHQPFNSFTAVRGFAAWLKAQPWAQPYQIAPVPNQLFVWSMPKLPLQTFAAIPVPDAKSALAQVDARLTPIIDDANTRDYFMTPISLEKTNTDIAFVGMPFVAPYLRALSEPAGQFLFWETFPNTPQGKPLPPQVSQQLAVKNLVYYHWEYTAERFPQLLQMTQLGLMISSHKQLAAGTAAFNWLRLIGGTLGNTDTVITQTGPAEFTFSRKAPGLFTGLELFTFANWLEATNFPGCDLKLPPHSPEMKQLHQRQLQQRQQHATPAPAPGH